MPVLEYIVKLLQSGLGNLAAYLAAHVLLCLLPAFFIAGGLTAFIPKEAVTRFLGRTTPKYISYPAAALAGSVLAVCSCTIVPLFAGIYKKGAGLGPAITFLFFAPAANILALSYTGVAIGMDLAVARLLLSLTFGIGIGMIMASFLVGRMRSTTNRPMTPLAEKVPPATGIPGPLVALLLSGTFKISLLTNSYAGSLAYCRVDSFQAALDRLVPYDAAKGEEGLSVQGIILIGLLVLIGISAWKGFSHVDEGYSRWTWAALILIVLTLLVAGVSMAATPEGLLIRFPGKFFAVALFIAALWLLARRAFEEYEIRNAGESEVRPADLSCGRRLCRGHHPPVDPSRVDRTWPGTTPSWTAAGVLFGVFMYFPTGRGAVAKMFLGWACTGPLLPT